MRRPVCYSHCVLALGALLLSAPLSGVWPQGEESSCEVCHSDERAAYKDSIHRKAGFECHDCHGGDPTDMLESAMSSRHGFKPAPTREEIPEYCGSCHADRDMMRPYGLPTTQLEEYGESRHGVLHAQGDMTPAVCTDCHSSGEEKGRHDILAIDDTRASVYPNNLPTTCGNCHSDTDKMASYGIPTDQRDLYKESVHGQALLVGGNEAAATCVICHGSHGALPPGATHIDEVCGRCHQKERDLLAESPHAGLSRTAGDDFKACLSCHGEEDGGGHGIMPPTRDKLRVVCAQCHDEPEIITQGERLDEQLAIADEALEKARGLLEEANRQGFHVPAWENTIERALTDIVQARISQHSLTLHDVEQYTQAVESARDVLDEEIGAKLEAGMVRRAALVPVWGFLLWTITMLYWRRVRILRDLHIGEDSTQEANDH